MTEAALQQLSDLREELRTRALAYAVSVEGLLGKITAAERDCDHENPDGTSAIKKTRFITYCHICNWSD